MARGRFISDSVGKDLRLNGISIEAELVYLMTIPHLDRDGLIEADPDLLFGAVCPKRRELQDRIALLVQEWAKAGLVLMYDTEQGPILWFKGFAKNQLGLRYDREKPSGFAPPPGHVFTKDGITPLPEPAPEPARDVPSDVPAAADASGETPDADGEELAQCQVQDQVKDQDQDQSSPPPPNVPKDEDDDSEKKATIALTAKLHSVGVAITPYSVDSYMEHVKDYGIEAVLRGITAAADNGKQHRLNYVSRCIVTAAQGTSKGTQNGNHSGNSGADYQRPAAATFTTAERVAYDAKRRAELPF